MLSTKLNLRIMEIFNDKVNTCVTVGISYRIWAILLNIWNYYWNLLE